MIAVIFDGNSSLMELNSSIASTPRAEGRAAPVSKGVRQPVRGECGEAGAAPPLLLPPYLDRQHGRRQGRALLLCQHAGQAFTDTIINPLFMIFVASSAVLLSQGSWSQVKKNLV